MTADLPVSASPRMRALVAGLADSTATVLHRSPHALYVAVPGAAGRLCLGVLGSAATAVPCGLRLAAESLAGLRGERVAVRDGVLHVDDHALRVRRVVDVTVPPLSAAGLAAPVPEVSLPELPLGPAEVARCIVAEPELLVGRGSGLTPVGDDVLCGWLAVHRALGIATPALDVRLRDLLPRTTLLSGTLLDCAIRGEVVPQFREYVAALGTPREDAATGALLAVGHTSGAGLLLGAGAARVHLSTRNGVAA